MERGLAALGTEPEGQYPFALKTRLAVRQTTAMYGAGERSRTSDLLITNQLLYQLSYTGMEKRLGMRPREGAV